MHPPERLALLVVAHGMKVEAGGPAEEQAPSFERARAGIREERVEIEVLRGHTLRSPDSISPVTDTATIGEAVALAQRAHIADALYAYAVRLATATREHKHVRVGVSPRGVNSLTRAAAAYALTEGRGYVLPEDLKALLEPVFAHRILLTPDAQLRGVTSAEVLREAIEAVPVPLPGHEQ